MTCAAPMQAASTVTPTTVLGRKPLNTTVQISQVVFAIHNLQLLLRHYLKLKSMCRAKITWAVRSVNSAWGGLGYQWLVSPTRFVSALSRPRLWPSGVAGPPATACHGLPQHNHQVSGTCSSWHLPHAHCTYWTTQWTHHVWTVNKADLVERITIKVLVICTPDSHQQHSLPLLTKQLWTVYVWEREP